MGSGILPQYNGNISNQLWGSGLSNVFSYRYDRLNRLQSGISTGNISMSEELTYDAMGNISSLNRDGAGANAYSYTGNQLGAVANLTAPYVYDANGNASTDGRNGMGLTYNYLNLPKTATKAGLNLSYSYDANGRKLSKNNNGSVRNYIDGIEYNGSTIDVIHTEEGLAQNNGGTYTYQYNLTDHLGNVRYSFDVFNGVARRLQENNYYAFGKNKPVSPISGNNKYLYNGKEVQEELGEQYDYGARFYDPVIGRWNVVDPLAEKVFRVNPYTYADNNPANNIDPNGMETYYGDQARAIFSQLQSQSSSRPPDEFYVNASGNKTKVSDKGGQLYDYYNYASGTTNPLSGKTVAVGAISGQVLGIANKPSDINLYIPTDLAWKSGKIDNDYFFDGIAVGGAIGKPIFAGLSRLLGGLVEGAIAEEGTNLVYQGFDKSGFVRYVGITERDAAVRFGEHLSSGTTKSLLRYEVVPGATNLSRTGARVWEQNLINQFGLQKGGGQLLNKINSIAPKYWVQYGIQ